MPRHMKPPKSCFACPFVEIGKARCDVDNSVVTSNFGRPLECPLNASIVLRGERHV